MDLGGWVGRFTARKDVLSLHVCRALSTYSKGQAGPVTLKPDFVEASIMAAPPSRSPYKCWVLQEKVNATWVNHWCTQIHEELISIISESQRQARSTPQPAIATNPTACTSLDDSLSELDLSHYMADPKVTLMVQLPAIRSFPMGLALAASMLGVMINRPINPNVAFFGQVFAQWVVSGTTFTFINKNAIMALRRADPPITHFFIGESVEVDMSAIEGPATSTSDEDNCQDMAPIKVVVIKVLSDLLKQENRRIIYGAPWPPRQKGSPVKGAEEGSMDAEDVQLGTGSLYEEGMVVQGDRDQGEEDVEASSKGEMQVQDDTVMQGDDEGSNEEDVAAVTRTDGAGKDGTPPKASRASSSWSFMDILRGCFHS